MDNITTGHLSLIKSIIIKELDNNDFDKVSKLTTVLAILTNLHKDNNICHDDIECPDNNNDNDYYLSDCWDAENGSDKIDLRLVNKNGLTLQKCKELAFEKFKELYNDFEPHDYAPKSLNDIDVLHAGDYATYDDKWCCLNINSIDDKKIRLEYGTNKGKALSKTSKGSGKMKFVSNGIYALVELLTYATNGGYNSAHRAIIVKKNYFEND